MSRTSRVATFAALALGILCSLASSAVAHGSALKRVRFHGLSVRVPVSWPVYDLIRSPHTCVRFDRHAVYLGKPGEQEHCPVHAVGRTEALLLEPQEPGAAVAGSRSGAGAALAPSSNEVTVHRGGVSALATWGLHPALVERALRMPRSSLRRELRAFAAASTGGSAPTSAAPPQTGPPGAAPAPVGHVTKGLGFDPCATPSSATLAAWRSSPYRTTGVYIGGANMACAQPNLNRAWVMRETAAGWHFIPTYVGPQAPGSACGGCSKISASSPAADGAAAAQDAVARMRAVGLGTGNPIYYDMEAYSTGGVATRTVEGFLSAWTTTLHSAGYLSGVYSSAASGITDLAAAYNTSFVEPDDVWIAHWNGLHTVSDSYLPDGDWARHQRVHQFNGGQDVTYGGVTMNIDGDYIDGATASAGSTIPDNTFVQVSGTTAVYGIAGGAPLFVSSWNAFGGPKQVRIISAAQFTALSPYPVDGTFLLTTTGRIFRMAGGAPLPVGAWTVFGGQQPSASVDEWDLENIGNPLVHLLAQPALGTVVEGLPSQLYWRFVRGGRTAVGTGPARAPADAVQVDDAALSSYAVVIPPPCVVPSVRRLTVAQAQRLLSRAHCSLGAIRRPAYPTPRHVLRIRAQSVAPRTQRPGGYPVAVTLI